MQYPSLGVLDIFPIDMSGYAPGDFDTDEYYVIENNIGSSYQWWVEPSIYGNVALGQFTSYVTISWQDLNISIIDEDKPEFMGICVQEIDVNGCVGDTFCLPITDGTIINEESFNQMVI